MILRLTVRVLRKAVVNAIVQTDWYNAAFVVRKIMMLIRETS
jgi:hypothetical protein